MEIDLTTLVIFMIILVVFWGTLKRTLSVLDKGLDTFNSVSDRSLDGIDVGHEYDHSVRMGKLKNKIESGKKPVATTADIRAMLKSTPKAED
jgi:hypothetical protein